MLEIIGIFAGILSASAFVPYIRDILGKTTKPERASWLIWTVLTSIAFFSQLAKGASNSLWQPGLETVGIVIILLLSLKYGVGGFTKRDILALLAASIGLILWYFTREAAVALYISIGIDSIGTVLTVVKAYEDPGSETMSTWVIVCIAGLLSMVAVGQWNIILLSYPFYIFTANGATALAMVLGRKPKRKR